MHSALGRSCALRYLQHSTCGRVYLFPFGHRPRMPISRIEDSALLPSCCASEHDPLSYAQHCSRIGFVCEWLDPSELHSPYTAFLKAAVASDQSVGRAIVREWIGSVSHSSSGMIRWARPSTFNLLDRGPHFDARSQVSQRAQPLRNSCSKAMPRPLRCRGQRSHCPVITKSPVVLAKWGQRGLGPSFRSQLHGRRVLET
jgi:hypothetical protein